MLLTSLGVELSFGCYDLPACLVASLTPRLGFLGLCSFQTTEELKTYPKVGFLNVSFVAEDREI